VARGSDACTASTRDVSEVSAPDDDSEAGAASVDVALPASIGATVGRITIG